MLGNMAGVVFLVTATYWGNAGVLMTCFASHNIIAPLLRMLIDSYP